MNVNIQKKKKSITTNSSQIAYLLEDLKVLQINNQSKLLTYF